MNFCIVLYLPLSAFTVEYGLYIFLIISVSKTRNFDSSESVKDETMHPFTNIGDYGDAGQYPKHSLIPRFPA